MPPMKLRTRQYVASEKRSDHKTAMRLCPEKRSRISRKIAPIPIKSTSQLYEVQNVTKKRWGESGWEYFVSWAGYPPSDDMWITECPPYFKEQWETKEGAPDTRNFDLLVTVACTCQRL
jgi:hypothetical protein